MTTFEDLPMSSGVAAPTPTTVSPGYGGGEGVRGALLAAATLSVWVGTLAIGLAGFVLPYPRGRIQPEAPPVVVKTIAVEPVDDATPPEAFDAAASLPPEPQPPALPEPPASPPAPAAVALEALNPVVVAPSPAPSPAPVVAASPPPAANPQPAPTPPRARQDAPANSGAAKQGAPGPTGPPAVRHLKFGVGAGRQPRPEYPREARIAKQQGSVVVQFTVGEDGRVVRAEITRPCRWPMLNQAAARVVREKWDRFEPGVYDVLFEFTMSE
jgi:protein TonB